jgi:transcriptional regulator with XRE-family HTH domain
MEATVTEPEKLKPSKVFVQRLRENRVAHRVTQKQLAERMTKGGRPMSRAALLQLEKGERGLSLDEAVGLAMCLFASPAQLLTPPEGTQLALTDKWPTDGAGLRAWLITGDPGLAWPTTPKEADRDALDEILKRQLAVYAQLLVDAIRGKDEAGRNDAYKEIVNAIERHREALEAIEDRKGRVNG